MEKLKSLFSYSSSKRLSPRGQAEKEEEVPSCLLLQMLPPELLWTILSFVAASDDERDLAAWCLTCSAFNNLCDSELRARMRCMKACPVLFGLKLTPIFGADTTTSLAAVDGSASRRYKGGEDSSAGDDHAHEQGENAQNKEEKEEEEEEEEEQDVDRKPPKLTWQERAKLLEYLPSRVGLCKHQMTESSSKGVLSRIIKRDTISGAGVDRETGLRHVNVNGDYCNLLANHPFLSTNEAALAKALARENRDSREMERIMRSVLWHGVEYFEMTVEKNTVRWNRAAAIAISHYFTNISFLGWTDDSIAYHSDDATIRGGPEGRVYNFRLFSTGVVVGCGIDWDSQEVFFVRNATPSSHTEVHIHTVKLDRKEWYAAIGSMVEGDALRANLGGEPFVFDLKTFIQKKRAGTLVTMKDVLIYTPDSHPEAISAVDM